MEMRKGQFNENLDFGFFGSHYARENRFSTNLAKTQKFIEAILHRLGGKTNRVIVGSIYYFEAIKNDENERRNFAIPDNQIVMKIMIPTWV